MENFVGQCGSFEDTVAIDRQRVELLKDGWNITILSKICDNMCRGVLNTLHLC